MTTQTYCNQADLEALWSAAAVLRSADDDEDGALSAAEEGYIARAIERAANKMNACLETRYALAALSGNTWCRDCNAAIAAYLVATRRGNPAPEHIAREYASFFDDLNDIRAGRLKVPQAGDTHETIPTVTNFDTDLHESRSKVRRVGETSTGGPPPSGRKSHPAQE
jgi:phage gp36-like protein